MSLIPNGFPSQYSSHSIMNRLFPPMKPTIPEGFCVLDTKVPSDGGYLVPEYFVARLCFMIHKYQHKKNNKKYPYRGNRINRRTAKLLHKWGCLLESTHKLMKEDE